MRHLHRSVPGRFFDLRKQFRRAFERKAARPFFRAINVRETDRLDGGNTETKEEQTWETQSSPSPEREGWERPPSRRPSCGSWCGTIRGPGFWPLTPTRRWVWPRPWPCRSARPSTTSARPSPPPARRTRAKRPPSSCWASPNSASSTPWWSRTASPSWRWAGLRRPGATAASTPT